MSPLPRLALFASVLIAALALGAGLGAWVGPTPSTRPTHPAPMQPMEHEAP